MKKDRVEYLPGRRVQPEGDVREPEQGRDAGKLGFDTPNALEGLDTVASALLHPRRKGEGEGIEEEVLGLEAVAFDRDVADGLGRSQLPFGRAGLALLVDAGTDHGGPELPGQPQEFVEPGPVSVPLFEVY